MPRQKGSRSKVRSKSRARSSKRSSSESNNSSDGQQESQSAPISSGRRSRASGRIQQQISGSSCWERALERQSFARVQSLLQDNHHEDPHRGIELSRNVPQFRDALEKKKKKNSKPKEQYRSRRILTLDQMMAYELQVRPGRMNYMDAQVRPTKNPLRTFCTVCGYFGTYKCVACFQRYCSVECLNIHKETRCLKWVH